MAVITWPVILNMAYAPTISHERVSLERMLRLVEARPGLKADMLALTAALNTKLNALP